MENRGKTWVVGALVVGLGCSSESFSSGEGGADAAGGSAGATAGAAGAALGGAAGATGGAAGATGGAAGATGGAAGATGGAAGSTGGAAGSTGGAAGSTGGAAGATGGAAGSTAGAAGASGGAAGAGTGGAGASGGTGGSGGIPNVACVEPLPGAGLTCCTSPALTTVAWKDARAHCQSLGLDLVKVEDNAKNQLVAATLPKENTWIGLSDTQTETKFVWVDGAPLGTFKDWATLLGEPDSKAPAGHAGQNCVFVNLAGKWFDAPCGGTGLYSVTGWCCE